MKSKHTPTPWKLQGVYQVCGNNLSSNDGWIVSDCVGPDKEENAAFIVKACNNHEALLDAVRNFLDWHSSDCETSHDLDFIIRNAQETVTKIKGKDK